MSLDVGRAGRAVVLLAWAGFFVWARATGEASRWLGPRTYWVASFGAVAIGVTALMQLAGLRGRGRGATVRDALGWMILLMPLFLVVAVPNAGLGAQAAARKSLTGPLAGVSPLLPDPSGPLSFAEIHWANASDEYALRLGISPGTRVDLTGFVSSSGSSGGVFALARFYVSCCAADAIPYEVTVDAPAAAAFPTDTWLRVRGTIERRNSSYIIAARVVDRVSEPDDPYLY